MSITRCLALAIAVALAPATASAATSARIGPAGPQNVLFITGGAEVNTVTVAPDGDATRVSDPAGVTPDTGCTPLSATAVTCPLAASDRLEAQLGAGNDGLTITDTFVHALIAAGSGDDVVRIDSDLSGASPPILAGQDGNDILAGGPARETFDGGDGRDWLIGRGGNDHMTGGAGPDVLDGGAGADTIDYSDRNAPVAIILDNQPNDGANGEGDFIVPESSPNPAARQGDELRGGQAGDFLVGDGGGNVIAGGAGSDVIDGAGGADLIGAAEGNDYVVAGSGDDTVNGHTGSDTLLGQDGNDRIHANAGLEDRDGAADVVSGGAGIDIYLGLDPPLFCGFDGPFYCTAVQSSLISLDDAANDNAESDNIRSDIETVLRADSTLVVDTAGDIIVGNAANNAISTLDGPDRIAPLGGNDLVLAGGGDDLIDTRDGVLDQIDCGTGADFLRADAVDQRVGCETVELP